MTCILTSNTYKCINVIRERLSLIIEWFLLFIIGIIVISPLLGTLFEFLGLSWNGIVVGVIVILSGLLASFIIKYHIFAIDSWKELAALFFILFLGVIIYGQYAPILELRQDPSVYILKALNLVNYGHTYKPAETIKEFVEQGILQSEDVTKYAAFQNGTKYMGGKLYTDFYPGGAFFYAVIGVISKRLIFYAQSILMLASIALMFFGVKRILLNHRMITKFFFTAAFFVAPIIVWFGRGSYSEPSALFFTLLILNILLVKDVPAWLLILVFCSSYSSRIDYLLLLLIGVFAITYINYKAGAIYSIICIGEIIIFKAVYWIYYNRITKADMPYLKYGMVFIIVAFLISFLIAKWGRKWIEQVYYCKAVKVIMCLIGFLCTLLMFRDNIIPADSYQHAIIHGQEMRTYVEHIWDLLFMVFPSVILVIGILGIVNFISKKQIPFVASVFLVGSIGVYLYFFLAAGNSPQLYWMLRRYYNIILPLAFLSCILFFENWEKNSVAVISGVCLMLSTNLYFNSNQIPDYVGLDQSVRVAAEDLEKRGVERVFYDEDIRYEISSIMSYSDAEFIPISSDKYLQYIENNDTVSGEDDIWISKKDYGNSESVYNITFKKLGEDYGEVPKKVYDNQYVLYGYTELEFTENYNKIIFPGLQECKVEGFQKDGQWTTDTINISLEGLETSAYQKMKILLFDYSNYLLDNYPSEIENISLMLNNGKEIKPSQFKDNIIFFDISNVDIMLKNVKINCNTFNPNDLGLNEDKRDLGLAIKRIEME